MVIEYPIPAGTVLREQIQQKGEADRVVEWKFEKQYPHHATFKNGYGIRRSFSNAELLQRKIIFPQVIQ